jgi:hypothetical protein
MALAPMKKLQVILTAVLAVDCFGASGALDGVWRSQGWGFLYQVRGADWQAFEITKTTCVAGSKAKRVTGGRPGSEVTFQIRRGNLFSIVDDGDSDHKRITMLTGLTSIAIERIGALPKACTPPIANTPLNNFDVFTQTFAEQYISFDLRHVNWERLVAEQREKVTARTTPAELFDILSSAIKPLTDIHTGIDASKLKREFDAPMRPGSDRVVHGDIKRFAKAGRRQLAGITDRRCLHGSVVPFCRGEWQYGMAENGIGYLRILGFGDYGRGGYDADVRALNRALDRILGNAALRALIIDLRLSFGGDDRLGLAIAARLTAREYMAYAIQARSDPVVPNRYTPAQPVMVRPAKQPVFSGPVVELIGPITMSAAETFTQALMERTPRVLRIGENTQGVFCDVLDRHLPNCWNFGLPNAVYRTSDGLAFDVVGIPPDITVPVFLDKDIAAGRDPAMDAAIRSLRKHDGGR